jgi:hypothetical protein
MGKPKRQPIYFRAVRLVDPQTGLERSAFVPASAADLNTIQERGIKIGDVLRGDVTRPRNIEFHRLAHAIGGLVAENIEKFAGKKHHEVLKQLQFESGVECDVTRTELPEFGMVLESKQPRSMAFDCMEQGAFYEFVRGICTHIASEYWPQCTPEEIESMAQAMLGVSA